MTEKKDTPVSGWMVASIAALAAFWVLLIAGICGFRPAEKACELIVVILAGSALVFSFIIYPAVLTLLMLGDAICSWISSKRKKTNNG